GYDNAYLEFSAVGSDAVTSVSVGLSINPIGAQGVQPPWSGSMELVCIELADGFGEACIEYRDATLSLAWSFTGGAAVGSSCAIPDTLTSSVWTDISLEMEVGGLVTATIGNGEPVACDNVSGASTSVATRVGIRAGYGETGAWSVRIDNVEVVVER